MTEPHLYRIIQHRRILYVLSGVFMLASVVFIALGGLKLGIDFTGGSRLVVQFHGIERPPAREVVAALETLQLGEVIGQPLGDQSYALRMRTVTDAERSSAVSALQERYPGLTEDSFETVGPVVGQQLQQRSLAAILLVLLAIVTYISIAFRKSTSGVIRPWTYGVGAVIALIHDVIVVMGFFALLGLINGVEVGTLFVTALLTILGFSVHDTIVVYDRLRENLRYRAHPTFETAVNVSVNETLVRSLNTSLTTIFVLLALYLFGGSTIQDFVLALIVGIITGTYSSIFIASPLLVTWHAWRQNR
ncbi:MAG: protein translocase subunit SecF [Candidatus Kerfeldbacteria bacterium]|nr:protein translocase subunit SecF [Candidatus Kerfeldbacteria bacterium]